MLHGHERKIVIFVVILAGMTVAQARAANISVMLVEAEEGKRIGTMAASEWETGMMDVLFDAGHIVSNARSRVPDNAVPWEESADFREAKEGGADYFIIMILDYEHVVDMRLFSTEKGTLIHGEKYVWSNKAIPRPAYFNAKRAVKLLIPYMGDML